MLKELPKNWCVNPKNEEEDQILIKFRGGGHTKHYSQSILSYKKIWYGISEISSYIEISFDDFKRLVLGETINNEMIIEIW